MLGGDFKTTKNGIPRVSDDALRVGPTHGPPRASPSRDEGESDPKEGPYETTSSRVDMEGPSSECLLPRQGTFARGVMMGD